METYWQFLDRIDSFEKKELNLGNQYFRGNPSILQKVDLDNMFRDFYGDTVVFTLDERTKETLNEYVELLYRSVSECFCERLTPDTFHMTLHDLSNSPSLQNVAEELSENKRKIMDKIEEIQKTGKAEIKMKSKYIFNMVDTSLVLGLYPAGEDAYHRLIELYSIFDTVKKLNYPFTPHITLAYYNTNGFDLRAARILENTVRHLNHNEIEINLDMNHLYYQKFKSMNDYINIINLGMVNQC
ncbi:MAG: ligT like phosphoesterase [Lachnospiraceae bacterium]|nr:ligT like phosphoesterase [Lachnospiraceae bacterium]